MFRRSLSACALFGLSLFAALAATAASPNDKVYTLGKENAPITIVEYASYTCSHCANFNNNVLPQLKKDWIDTGKVKMVYRDFPLDQVALGISMLTYCAPAENYHALRSAFFAKQDQWIKSKNLRLDLFTIAREVGGLSEPDSAKCLADQELAKQLQTDQKEAVETLKIDSTPTFTINGSIIRGAPSYDDLVKILKSAGG